MEARDQGVNSVPVYATVVINVLDRNDNAPAIKVSFLDNENGRIPSISEDAAVGSFVAFVSVTDSDRGEAGRVETFLQETDDFALETVDAEANRYMLKTKNALDRERIERYSLTIVARDGGDPPLQSTELVEIRVEDINDNAPFFHQSQYRVSVDENNKVNEQITTLKARDLDAGK